jgi:lipopolysaccharide export system permease protein
MKKLDKLIVTSFIGPFFLTFCVVVFIFLLQFILQYIQDLVGKGLGFGVYAQLLAYFSINMTPNSFPLAILLSSLITYGNLGEHSELTAIKGSGISLNRTLIPIFLMSILLTIIAYYSNDNLVPKANLKAYSLLWDIKNKTPALNLKEGVFYNDIPGYQIKVAKKFPDSKSLKTIIVYDHTKSSGNKEITLADSGQMYTILNQRYLVMDLYNGNYYSEQDLPVKGKSKVIKASPFARSSFQHSRIVFSMASFDLKRTKEELFKGNRVMKNVLELRHDVDSMQEEVKVARCQAFLNLKQRFKLQLGTKLVIPEELKSQEKKIIQDQTKPDNKRPEFPSASLSSDSVLKRPDTLKKFANAPPKIRSFDKKPRPKINRNFLPVSPPKLVRATKIDSVKTKPRIAWEKMGVDSILFGSFNKSQILKVAVTDARYIKNHFMVASGKVESRENDIIKFEIQRYKIFAQAFACIIMFLIGAPLGAIIKKGGLGFPVILSIGFFIIYYVFMITGEKWAKQEMISAFTGVWLPNVILMPFGIFFLIQARKDAKLFDSDFYLVSLDKMKTSLLFLFKKKN